MKAFFQWLFALITFKAWRIAREAKRRRKNYEFLKDRISERHFGGFAGLTVDFYGYKFDAIDMSCFKPPMYGVVKNQKGQYCIFWDRSRMVAEIGTGEPLKEGELAIPDHPGRTKPDSTLDTIDERKPLTQRQDVNGQETVSPRTDQEDLSELPSASV